MSEKKNTGLVVYVLFTLGLLITSVGDSLVFKAAIGVSPYESVQMSISYLTGINVGTIAIVCHLAFVAGQLLLLRRMTFSLLLQIPVSFIQGSIVNLIVYTVFGNLEPSYPVRVLFLLGGICLIAIGIGIMVWTNVTVFPLEGFCKVLSDRKQYRFEKVRQVSDIVFLSLSLLATFLFHLPFAVREGTVISALIFSPMLGIVIKFLYGSFRAVCQNP
ncbi:MAG: hypothetical protein IJI24_08240 [Lachnospiraceae bacterium]|nr:hypothetical protein [Lachnospiraceae bacterium]